MYNPNLVIGGCVLIGLMVFVEARLGGGYLEPIATDDQEVRSLSAWAADKLDGTLIHVVSAKRQIVAGWLYHIDIHMENKHHQMMNCSVRVWIRHWLNSVRLAGAKCNHLRQ